MLYLDFHSVGATWNQFFSKGKLEGGSVLDSDAKFFGKMDIHRFNTAYVLRYRAFWDKLMGLLVLMHAPQEYKSFDGAKKKRSCFAKIAKKHNFEITGLSDLLSRFDDKFRTPEAHGTGVLRKYSFTMQVMSENPQIELIDFWNVMNNFILDLDLGKAFNNATRKLTIRP